MSRQERREANQGRLGEMAGVGKDFWGFEMSVKESKRSQYVQWVPSFKAASLQYNVSIFTELYNHNNNLILEHLYQRILWKGDSANAENRLKGGWPERKTVAHRRGRRMSWGKSFIKCVLAPACRGQRSRRHNFGEQTVSWHSPDQMPAPLVFALICYYFLQFPLWPLSPEFGYALVRSGN